MAKNENLQKKFGAKLAYIRKSKNLSQMKLAEFVVMIYPANIFSQKSCISQCIRNYI